MEHHREDGSAAFDLDKVQQLHGTQRKVYQQLVVQTNLQGMKLYRNDEVEGCVSLEITLKSGLANLRVLRVLGVDALNHNIGVTELE